MHSDEKDLRLSSRSIARSLLVITGMVGMIVFAGCLVSGQFIVLSPWSGSFLTEQVLEHTYLDLTASDTWIDHHANIQNIVDLKFEVTIKNLGQGAVGQDICFDGAVNLGTGDGPQSVVAADLDGDSDADLAVAIYFGGRVAVLKNNGDGTFAAAVNYLTGNLTNSVFAADLDGDDDADLAVANDGSDNVSVLLNNGDGTFVAAVNYAAGDRPFSVSAADLDGDDDADLAVANYNGGSVSVLFNNGDGTFAAAVNYFADDGPRSVIAADLDGDNDADLATANWFNSTVSVLLNNGDGSFAAAVNYTADDGVQSVFAADLDGDNDADLAVANFYSNNVSVLKNNGNGTFAAAVDYAAGDGPWSVFGADLDGDGDADLAVTNTSGASVSVLENIGSGAFAAGVPYGVGTNPHSVVAADLDGDNDADLAVANVVSDNVSVLMNCGSATELDVYVSPNSYSTLPEVVGGATRIVHGITIDPGETRTISFAESESYLENLPTFLQLVEGGQFYVYYALPRSGPSFPFNIEIFPDARLMVTFSADQRLSSIGPLSASLPSGTIPEIMPGEDSNEDRPNLSDSEDQFLSLSIGPSVHPNSRTQTWALSSQTSDSTCFVVTVNPPNGGTCCVDTCEGPASCCVAMCASIYSCPFQSDIDANGFVDAVDLAIVIDVVFFGAPDAQDQDCPNTRSDFTGDGFADAIDLAFEIDFVFFGADGPAQPCTP